MSKSIFVILYVSILILSGSVLASDAVSATDKTSDAPASEHSYLYLKRPPKKPRVLPYDDPESFLFERQSDGTIKVIGRNDVTVKQIGKDEYEITYQNTGVKNVVNVSDTDQSN